MLFLEDINKAKHIVIKCKKQFLPSASALYTYILTLHKKVSLICEDENIDISYGFLPWLEKIKHSGYSSADFILELDIGASELYGIFSKNGIKLNSKMATALYGGLLFETDGFKNAKVDGMSFAIAKELVESKAEYKKCTKYVLNTKSLSYLRLKSIMLKKLILKDEAKLASIALSDDDFVATGADIEDAYDILKEAFSLPYVSEVELIKNNKILKTINKEV
jgi:phosphoesterase RecJ-like protein